jgi:two-component system phosphate regulon sensor histidine kinase PhoR
MSLMVAASPPDPAPEPAPDAGRARFMLRLSEGRWVIALAAVAVLGLVVAGELTLAAGAGLIVAFAAIIAVVPMRRLQARAAVAAVSPAAQDELFAAGLKGFADALPDACFLLDRRGLVRYANARALTAFGIAAGEALTLRLRVPELVAAFEGVARGGPAEVVEFSERVPTERWFKAWFARLAGSDLIALVIEDLSERKLADRVRVDFVANASHELRTPLASLAGFIETLQGPARDDPAARDRFLGIMHDQAGRMSRLVNDLLSLSRIEMKGHVRPSDPVDLVAVLRHVIDALEPLARDLGVAIEATIPAERVTVTGDRDELVQVFENLVENACKYGQSGKRVEVELVNRSGTPVVTIRDFGPGIPEEHLPRLTERFYRVDLDASRRHRGTGLGLAIAKHILARHQARLSIASRLGEGATFTVSFPQARA